jgi:hypothetical protein
MLWGFLGSAAVELMNLFGFYTSRRGRLPHRYRKVGFWITRFVLALVAGAIAVAYEIDQRILAFNIGAATPLIITFMAKGLKQAPPDALPPAAVPDRTDREPTQAKPPGPTAAGSPRGGSIGLTSSLTRYPPRRTSLANPTIRWGGTRLTMKPNLKHLIVFATVAIPLASIQARTLSLDRRIEAQRAIEQVYWSHRIWPRLIRGPSRNWPRSCPRCAAAQGPGLPQGVPRSGALATPHHRRGAPDRAGSHGREHSRSGDAAGAVPRAR